MSNINTELAKVLPDAGADRFWRVALDKRTPSKPIRVSLMEAEIPGSVIKGRRSLVSELTFVRTIADPEYIKVAADDCLKQVGDYKKLVGDYPEIVAVPVSETSTPE